MEMSADYMTTTQLATKLGLKAPSIRAALHSRGDYFGATPVKLPNGRLLWPANSLEMILGGAK